MRVASTRQSPLSRAEPDGSDPRRPPFDPECAAALAALTSFAPSVTADTIPLLRLPNPAVPQPTDEELAVGGAFSVEEMFVPGPAGAPDVSVLVCLPVVGAAPYPSLFYIHGGGMVSGDNRAGILPLLAWGKQLGAAVVSVEYRLAPETPHPGPVEDCYAGLVGIARIADELQLDRDRVVVVGESAGGGLAAAVCLLARDRGGPAIAGQLLMAPMLDDRNDSGSSHQMAGVGVWDRSANEVAWTALLGAARGGPDVSWYAAPARATDLSGLPPAFIDVGSAETFRDEDVDYALRIWQAGGAAELHVWPGGFHGFEVLAPHALLSQEARHARVRWLQRLLDTA